MDNPSEYPLLKLMNESGNLIEKSDGAECIAYCLQARPMWYGHLTRLNRQIESGPWETETICDLL